MNLLILKILTLILKFFSLPLILLPIKNKITILSRLSNKKTVDIEILQRQIEEELPKYKLKIITKKLEKSIKGYITYSFSILNQIYHIYTSKIVICDSYIPSISLTKKKKKVIIIQIWHALGAYKKFGFSAIDTYEGSSKKIATIMKMHKNYDYVICSHNNLKLYFKEAFKTTEKKIKIGLLPRYKYLENNQETIKKQILTEYPKLNNQKINIMYAPTFRKSKRNYFKEIIKNINYEKYNLILKKHGGDEIIYINGKKTYSNKNHYSIKLLCTADIIITDYSAITFDAMILNKPIYFYVPDLEQYLYERGMYINLLENFKTVYKNIDTLLKNINHQKTTKKQYQNIKNYYIDNKAKDVIEIITDILKGDNI